MHRGDVGRKRRAPHELTQLLEIVGHRLQRLLGVRLVGQARKPCVKEREVSREFAQHAGRHGAGVHSPVEQGVVRELPHFDRVLDRGLPFDGGPFECSADRDHGEIEVFREAPIEL